MNNKLIIKTKCNNSSKIYNNNLKRLMYKYRMKKKKYKWMNNNKYFKKINNHSKKIMKMIVQIKLWVAYQITFFYQMKILILYFQFYFLMYLRINPLMKFL